MTNKRVSVTSDSGLTTRERQIVEAISTAFMVALFGPFHKRAEEPGARAAIWEGVLEETLKRMQSAFPDLTFEIVDAE